MLQNVVPAKIAAAPAAIKVVEMENDEGQLFSGAQVAQMASGGGAVLGYFSIGEAENYRTYFSSLPKAAIGPEDPNWAGNYVVKYWTPEWKAVCTGYIDEMISRGYAGAYFDVVDVCESRWAKANIPGGDARGAMVDLIQSLPAYGRARDPDFKLWVNTSGAENLAANARFVNSIDGALEESLFYLGGQPNSAEGIRYNLNLLDRLVQAGKPVIAVEYVKGAGKVASVQAQAAAAGIGSYVANPDQALSGVNTEGFATLPPVAQPDPAPAGDAITGTMSNDRLVAHTGSDTLSGLAGNDIYVVRGSGNAVVESAGAGNDTGNAFSHTLMGNSGKDTLLGGSGHAVRLGWRRQHGRRRRQRCLYR